MAEPFLGEIRMFAGNFAPRGWALCDGQLLAVTQNDALFSLLGTTYGGDGISTFALPDLRGRIPIHTGTGPGLSGRPQGQKAGVEQQALSTANLPSHTHTINFDTAAGTGNNPAGSYLAASPTVRVFRPGTPSVDLDTATISTDVGGAQPHDNVMPVLAISFIIALTGIFPSRP